MSDSTPESLVDQVVETPRIKGCVAIGCSFESLESLESFFGTVPPDSGLAFLICAKVSVIQSSKVLGLLGQCSQLETKLASSGEELSPNTVYLNPPLRDFVYRDGRIELLERYAGEEESNPFDMLLRTLSQEGPELAVISLDGCGADGLRGFRRVEESGGMVLVEGRQEEGEETDETPGLFRRAKPQDMFQILRERFGSKQSGNVVALDEGREESEEIDRLLKLLEQVTGINFKQYKIATIKRRILHRMRQRDKPSLEFYYEYVRQNPEELHALYRDFMIGVTSFFRDAGAFESIERNVIPELFSRHDDGSEIRIWIPACATGEEAYSIAIACDEYARRAGIANPNYKIFATDAHQSSIRDSVNGFYDASKVDRLTLNRRQRYFIRTYKHYQVSPEIRKRVVFAEHNILRDPPFTKIDFISCRNLLIYFSNSAQKKALGLMLFSLRPSSFLLLGPSESPNFYLEELEAVDGKWRLFSKKSEPDFRPEFQKYEINLQPKAIERAMNKSVDSPSKVVRSTMRNVVEDLMERYMPPSIIIEESGKILHTFGDCAPYFVELRGKVSLLYDERVKPELGMAIKRIRQQALEENRQVSLEGVYVDQSDGHHKINLRAEPLPGGRDFEKSVHVVFEEPNSSLPPTGGSEPETKSPVGPSRSSAKSESELLRKELRETKFKLQSTVDQLEVTNQDLVMANEEMLTSNEELQSTNEELHSVNEELFSVNAEYERKNRELLSLNEDVNNLLRSTEIGTVFVDADLRIRKFTPAAYRSMNLLQSDLGRPIEHISHSLIGYDDLVSDTRAVIETGNPSEKEARGKTCPWVLVRILPFNTSDEEVKGAVITFIDVSALKQAEEEIRENERKLQLALEAANFGVWNWDLRQNEVEFDARLARILDIDPHAGKSDFQVAMNFSADRLEDYDFAGLHDREGFLQQSWSITLKNGEVRYLSGRGIAYRDDERKVSRVSGVVWDETDIKSQEQQVLQKKNDLETLLYVISHDLREPLRAIRNFSQMLLDRHADQLDEKAMNFLRRIDAGGNRMTSLLNDVLDLSRINRMETPTEEMPGDQLIEAAMRSLENKIQETGAQVVIASDLQDVRVNFTFAKQALYNLIGNALKFVNEGEAPQIEISPYVGDSKRHFGFVVRDRGPGIPENCRDRVFKLFQRAVGREVEGTGAGLAIVKQIALKHGGDVWYEPRPGGGSKFTITFLK